MSREGALAGQPYRRVFRAMGTEVTVLVRAPGTPAARVEAAVAEVAALFAAMERRFSRFLPDSELSRVNAAAGRWVAVSAAFADVLDLALGWAERTGGLFDPTVLRNLERLGYRRSFADGLDETAGPLLPEAPGWEPPRPELPRASFRDVFLDRRRQRVRFPAGVGLDFGGIAKGWTVDRAVRRLERFRHFVISAGGDLFASGEDQDGPWRVGIADPLQPGRWLDGFLLRDGAAATSGRARRRWRAAGRERHHLVDPRTGDPASGGLWTATVRAASAAGADAAATATFVMGTGPGVAWLNRQPDLEGLLVTDGGLVVASAGWRAREHAA